VSNQQASFSFYMTRKHFFKTTTLLMTARAHDHEYLVTVRRRTHDSTSPKNARTQCIQHASALVNVMRKTGRRCLGHGVGTQRRHCPSLVVGKRGERVITINLISVPVPARRRRKEGVVKAVWLSSAISFSDLSLTSETISRRVDELVDCCVFCFVLGTAGRRVACRRFAILASGHSACPAFRKSRDNAVAGERYRYIPAHSPMTSRQ